MLLEQSKIDLLKKYFETQPVLRAYLFGSYASGEANRKSDIDILVDLDYSQHIGLHFFKMRDDIEIMLQQEIDLVSSNGLSKYIFPQVEKEKKLIYARQLQG